MPDKFLIPGASEFNNASVSTPDPGPLPDECTIVAKVRGPFNGTQVHLVNQHENNGTDRSWMVSRRATDSKWWVAQWPLGTTASQTTPLITTGSPITGKDDLVALSMQRDDGTGNSKHQGWVHDGDAWAHAGAPALSTSMVYWDSSLPVRIGGVAASTTNRFDGRIYYIELRTGLDPSGGEVLWRFDANDYPGSGLSYTDPRGRTWTLVANGCISAESPGHHPTMRVGTAAEWAAANPVLARAEMVYSYDDRVVKLGNGTAAYDALTNPVTVQG